MRAATNGVPARTRNLPPSMLRRVPGGDLLTARLADAAHRYRGEAIEAEDAARAEQDRFLDPTDETQHVDGPRLILPVTERGSGSFDPNREDNPGLSGSTTATRKRPTFGVSFAQAKGR
ncbi:MAG: hypothetical protein IPG56_20755 [Caulobacteraceae bacterium]|nr:hypothetical protein [Caulobacteraceae bacterium]